MAEMIFTRTVPVPAGITWYSRLFYGQHQIGGLVYGATAEECIDNVQTIVNAYAISRQERVQVFPLLDLPTIE